METPQCLAFNIVILSALVLPFNSRARNRAAQGARLREPRAATAQIENTTSHSRLSSGLAKELLGPRDYRLAFSAAGKEEQAANVEIIWKLERDDKLSTTLLRISDGLHFDIIMQWEMLDASHQRNRVPLLLRPSPINSSLENFKGPARHRAQSHSKLVRRVDYRRLHQHPVPKGNVLPGQTAQLPTYGDVQTLGPKLSRQLPPAWENESSISVDESTDVLNEAYGSHICPIHRGAPDCPDVDTGSQVSAPTMITDSMGNSITDSLLFSLGDLDINNHDRLMVRDGSDQSIDGGGSVDADEVIKNEPDPGLFPSWIHGSNELAERHEASQDFRMHPGHKVWEWDSDRQRWHKKGGSHNLLTDYFPDNFV